MSRANVGSARSDGAGRTPRHVSLSPRSSSRAALSSASNPHSHSTAAAAAGDGSVEGSGELIITRGLKEILAKDMELKKSEERRGSGSLGKSPSLSRKGVAPNFITCYLCGQQFGSASIGIHQPQCYLKSLIAWERNDPALRGPKPLDPETHEKRIAERMAQGNTSSTSARPVSPTAAASTSASVSKSTTMRTKTSETRHQDVYNELQFEAFKKSLAPCPNCGRTFLPDRLVVHLRSCKVVAEANKPARTAGKPGAASSKPSTATRNTAAAAAAPVVAEPQRVDDAAMHKSQRKSASLSAFAEPSPRPPLDLAGIAQTNVGSQAAADKAVVVADDDNHEDVVVVVKAASRKTSIEKTEEARAVHRAESSHESPARETAQAKTRTATAAAVGESTTPRRSPRPRQPSLPTHDENRAVQESAAAAREQQPLQQGEIEAVHEEAEGQPTLSSRSLSETAEARSTPPLLLATQPGNSSSSNNNNNKEDEDAEGANANSREEEEGDDETAQAAFGEPTPALTRRIRLNNVSHFKQVPSRLRQQLRQQKATLVPCRYCGRHFMPTRLSTHEEVCVGRDHGPAGIHLSGSTHANTNTPTTITTAAAAAAGGSYRSNSGSKPGRSLTSLSMSENNNNNGTSGGGGGASVASPTMALAQRAGNENGSAKRRNSLTAGRDADVRESAEKASNAAASTTTTTAFAAVSAKPALRRSSAETRPQPRRSSGKPEAMSALAAPVANAEPTPPTPTAAAAAAAGETVPHFCGQCGTKLMSATQRFCIACGARIISA